MNGKITFAGAGPGAPDLITLRAAESLKDADVVIYAGSLVNEKILETASDAILYNSAKLSFPEVMELMIRYYENGAKVVRLHTGDPSMYGAVSEQYRELDKLGIPYEVIPGVSSVFAAAAALKVELTMPSLSQSVILTREGGRTPVPEGEELEKFAVCGGTLCIFLSVAGMESLVSRLISAGRSPDTPAAVVYRASWENQKIVRGTLGDIAKKVADADIKRQSMIVIGEVLNRDGGFSKLYDETFMTGYRRNTQDFSGKTAVFALTKHAVFKAAEIAAGLENATVFAPEKYADHVSHIRLETFPDGSFGKTFSGAWNSYEGFVMIMASGIVVRHLAELCSDKKQDPAVVVCDEAGNYAVSLLSGHVGGANALARAVAGITGGRAVITTASDVRNQPAMDEFAKIRHYEIMNPEKLTAVAAAILEEERVTFEMPQRLFEEDFSGSPHRILVADRTDGIIVIRTEKSMLQLRKRRFTLGVGCRKGVSAGRIGEVVEQFLKKHHYTMDEITVIASAEVKRQEDGLLEFARNAGKNLCFFSAADLNSVDVPHPSEAAELNLGIRSVSEGSALLAAGRGAEIVVGKFADTDVTAALAEEHHHA